MSAPAAPRAAGDARANRCRACGAVDAPAAPLLACGGCKVTVYCAPPAGCQRADWLAEGGHKSVCRVLRASRAVLAATGDDARPGDAWPGLQAGGGAAAAAKMAAAAAAAAAAPAVAQAAAVEACAAAFNARGADSAAVRALVLAADAGDAPSGLIAGRLMCGGGLAVPGKDVMAMGLARLEAAAAAGLAAAHTELAVIYLGPQPTLAPRPVARAVAPDTAKAVRHLRAAVALGDAGAVLALGDCLFFGTGMRRDAAEALGLFEAAAEAGNAQAMWRTATCYMNGTGTAKDITTGFEWCRKAADAGNAAAREALAAAKRDGRLHEVLVCMGCTRPLAEGERCTCRG